MLHEDSFVGFRGDGTKRRSFDLRRREQIDSSRGDLDVNVCILQALLLEQVSAYRWTLELHWDAQPRFSAPRISSIIVTDWTLVRI